MKLTRDQLLAAANSVMSEVALQDPYTHDLNGHVVKPPTETNGWRIYIDGRDCGGMVEGDIVLRGLVMAALGGNDMETKLGIAVDALDHYAMADIADGVPGPAANALETIRGK